VAKITFGLCSVSGTPTFSSVRAGSNDRQAYMKRRRTGTRVRQCGSVARHRLAGRQAGRARQQGGGQQAAQRSEQTDELHDDAHISSSRGAAEATCPAMVPRRRWLREPMFKGSLPLCPGVPGSDSLHMRYTIQMYIPAPQRHSCAPVPRNVQQAAD
jgi:hypothetical protein